MSEEGKCVFVLMTSDGGIEYPVGVYSTFERAQAAREYFHRPDDPEWERLHDGRRTCLWIHAVSIDDDSHVRKGSPAVPTDGLERARDTMRERLHG